MRTIVGGRGENARSPAAPPMSSVSSSETILTTCWPGLSLPTMSAPRARSFTALVKLLTTLKLTSASRSARRISRMAALMSASVRVPRPRTSDRVAWSFSARESNMVFLPPEATAPGKETASGHQRPREVRGVEGAQILELLPHPDQLDRDAELLRDGERDPALGGAVELGQHEPGHVDRLREGLGLAQPVLSGGGVNGEQRLVGGLGDLLGDDPAYLGQLGHEVVLGVQAPRGVDQDHVGTLAARLGDRIEGHRGRVGAEPALDEVHSGALRPQLELLHGRRSERVAGGQHDRPVELLAQMP